MADCQRHREKFSEYIDGVLDSRERRPVEEHLGECSHCRRELDAWRRLVADVSGLPQKRAPAGFTARVLARIEGPARPAQSPLVTFLVLRALPVAAMITVVLGLTLTVNRAAPPEQPRPVGPIAMDRGRLTAAPVAASESSYDVMHAPELRARMSVAPVGDMPADRTEAAGAVAAPPALPKPDRLDTFRQAAELADFRTQPPAVPREDEGVLAEAKERLVTEKGAEAQDARYATALAWRARGVEERASPPVGPEAVRFMFNQVAPAQATQARVPAQQVLTFMVEDQTALAGRVVTVANRNGLQPVLALEGAEAAGALELHMTIPAARYGVVLEQLSDLTPPQNQALANTLAASGEFFELALKDYDYYQDARASGEKAAAPAPASAAGLRRARARREAEAERVTLGALAGEEVLGRPLVATDADLAVGFNLVVRVLPPAPAGGE